MRIRLDGCSNITARRRPRGSRRHGPLSAGESLQEALTWLGETGMAAPLARARLTYGEWLRRDGRRVDAREQLRAAYEAFVATVEWHLRKVFTKLGISSRKGLHDALPGPEREAAPV